MNDELQIVWKQLYNPSQTEQTADICPPQQLTHLKPPDLQTDKTSAFSIFTVADAQIIKYMWLAADNSSGYLYDFTHWFYSLP